MPSAFENLMRSRQTAARRASRCGRVCGPEAFWRSTRLADAGTASLALESRFDLAYNAAHALCLAALRWHGYRSGHRYLVFQLLPHTLGLGPDVWRVLAKCHDVRNKGEYEGDLNVNERLVTDLLAACRAVATKLDALGPVGGA